MKILGIESSCDETSCAVVEDGRVILSNVISSQIALHQKTGGVVPEVAAREHVIKIVPVIEQALREAKIKLSDIEAVAVTKGPGLLSSLLVGINAAMTISLVQKIPLIPVNHIEGHMYANWLTHAKNLAKKNTPKFPIVVLTASGGHNELILWKGHGDYKFLGATLDDAAGEAFDKVARLLGLGYPGGPAIQKVAFNGNPNKYPLPRAWVTGWDFSFSGLKTAVLRLVQKHAQTANSPRKLNSFVKLPTQFVCDVAASFQESVCEVLATKLIQAAQKFRVKEIHLAGGVSANARLREYVKNLMPTDTTLRYCEDLKLCTDNAAMIAAVGYFKYKKKPGLFKKWTAVLGDPNLGIKMW